MHGRGTVKKNRLSPTPRGDRHGRKNGRSRRLRRPLGKSGPRPAPEIFVRCDANPYGYRHFARCHLRNRKGYVYLCWRDGDKFRTHYLGKAPRKSPTPEDLAGASSGPAAAGADVDVRGARIR